MKLRKQVRSASAERVQLIEGEDRLAEFSFSSEEPVERMFGTEVLDHSPGAANLSRVNTGAPLLWNHDPDKVIGVVESAEIRADRRGYAKVRFAKNAFAEEKFQDVKDGILRNVSFAYEINKIEETKQGGNKPPLIRVKEWFPFEISVVSIPADQTVGFGRAESDDENEVEVEVIETKTTEGVKRMSELNTKEIEQKSADNAIKTERDRSSSIIALGDKYGMADLAREFVNNGKSVDEARAAVLERMGQKQKPVTGNEQVIGMSQKEKQEFSFTRALAAMAFPKDGKIQDAAGFEREISEAASQKSGKAARGFMIPVDMLRAGRRDLLVGTSTAGGHTVATELQSGSFIDMLRAKAVAIRAGAQMLNGLQGNIAIPRQTGGATAYWVAENGAPTESQQAFDQVSMSPKTLGAFTDISRKLILQSSIDVENFVKNDLATVIALALDSAAINGSGSSNQPLGLVNQSGINTQDFVAATPTFAEVVGMETQVAADNADIGALKYLFNATMRGGLKTAQKASGYPVYLLENGQLNGYSTECSNQVASGDILFGNFSDLIIGLWSGLDLLVDPYTGGAAGTVRTIVHQDCDVAVRHPESFCRGNASIA